MLVTDALGSLHKFRLKLNPGQLWVNDDFGADEDYVVVAQFLQR